MRYHDINWKTLDSFVKCVAVVLMNNFISEKNRVIQNHNGTFSKAYKGLFLILKRAEKCFLNIYYIDISNQKSLK